MKCQTEGCKNKARTGRKICTTCKSRLHWQKYPLKYWHTTLKYNAKRREKEFTLTLEEFEEFCKQTGYGELKGRTATSLSIDRVDNNLGYSKDNIKAITLSENSSKKNKCLGVDENDPPF